MDCKCHKPAMGHAFGPRLRCTNRAPEAGIFCGVNFFAHQNRPTPCQFAKLPDPAVDNPETRGIFPVGGTP